MSIKLCFFHLATGQAEYHAPWASCFQHWEVFREVSEVFILVPALLGLKGNLEMTLASRLSTQANLGNMDSRVEQWKMIGGNIVLTQVGDLRCTGTKVW